MLFNLFNNFKFCKLQLKNVKPHVSFLRKFSDISSLKVNNQLTLTADEQKYILQKINDADAKQLKIYNLPKNRIQKLNNWKMKNGNFKSISDILNLEGFGTKTVDKLCFVILNTENDKILDLKEKQVKIRGQILTPILPANIAKSFTSAVGIHFYATGLCWARIEKENNFVTHWESYEYNTCKKLSPIDALQIIVEASAKIPVGDLYIFEATISATPTALQSAISVAAHVQKIQLLSMLITILRTSPNYNVLHLLDELWKNYSNVYFLRHRLPARLFQTLIGTERVSAATTVLSILENSPTENIVHSPISIDENLKDMYKKQTPVSKEVLGQVLLLLMTFFDVCIYQNPNSIKAISSTNK